MTSNVKKGRSALNRLADVLVDDIMNTSDEDILAEITEDYGDSEKLANDMRALFETTIEEFGKSKLAAAKQAVKEARSESAAVVNIDQSDARRRYNKMITDDKKLTMAARKGSEQSERDIMNTIEDLAELGAFDDEEETDK